MCFMGLRGVSSPSFGRTNPRGAHQPRRLVDCGSIRGWRDPYLLLEMLIERLQGCGESDGGSERTGMWMIYIAVTVDLTGDGLVIGAGSAISTSLAFILATGQMLANNPDW